MSSKEVCKDYLRGECKRDSCKFEHPKDAQIVKPEGGGAGKREICQDFLRNACGRGDRCKYSHVRDDGSEVDKQNELRFCHDFQNRGCNRLNCRFIHSNRFEEEDYLKMGKVSDNLARAILKAGQGTLDSIAGIAVCKDFVSGKCERGRARCKYWHFMPEGENDPLYGRPQPQQQPGYGDQFSGYGTTTTGMQSYGVGFNQPWEKPPMFGMGGANGFASPHDPVSKRPRIEYPTPGLIGASPMPAGGVAPQMRELQEENLVLKHKVEVLKKQVADLTAANEVLLEQNARLRAKMQVGYTTAASVAECTQAGWSNAAADARSIASIASSVTNLGTTSVLGHVMPTPASAPVSAAQAAAQMDNMKHSFAFS